MSFFVRVIIILLALLGLSVFLRNRRKRHPHAEPGEDVGRPESATLAAPDAVELGTDVPPPAPVEKWEDRSKRRKLPPGEYRAAADEPETEPEPLS
jgi:hypothetical protein